MSMRILFPLTVVLGLAACGITVAPPITMADDRDPPVDDRDPPVDDRDPPAVRIIGYERFHRQTDPQAEEAGLLLLGELNCVACHAASDQVIKVLDSKRSPILSEIGSRVRPEYYRELLANPQHAKAGATMPALFDDSKEAKQQIEALAHFLAATGKPTERAPSPVAGGRGRQHFRRLGCAACHDIPEDNAPINSVPVNSGSKDSGPGEGGSVPLGDLVAKYTIASLAKFLSDPLHVRPSGRMPALNLNKQESNDLASYLLRDLKLPAGLTFEYYEGSWQELPDFDKMIPKAKGSAHSFDVGIAARRDHFGLRFEGKIQLAESGEYTFHVGSDDGSRLWIDGSSVIENDKTHPFSFKSGKRRLDAGEHTVRVDYFEQGGDQRVALEVEGPGLPRQGAEGLLVVSSDDRKAFRVDPQLARVGREVFQRVGCAACHTLAENGRELTSAVKGPPLADLQTTHGCLANEPAGGLPRYALDTDQRAALQAALRALQANGLTEKSSDATDIHRTMVRFNCYACHARNETGGVEPQRNALFTSNQPEMGDEGRIPPKLTGVGDKLQVSWMRRIFDQSGKDRPYMLTRMPRFGEANLSGLAESFQRADKKEDDAIFETSIPSRRLKVAGRQMAGAKGYSCIKCHTFGKFRSTGIQSMSLTTMHKRLNPGWFQRYMLDPQAYRAGTRMPAAWPNGQVLLPKILANDADTQIHAVWTYLSAGDKAAAPLGLRIAPLELVPIDQAIVYRNFIEGAGTRAIGVGYPQRVNLAFDANNLRLALLWQGAFIDASKHWTGRGQGFQSPLGDNVLRLPDMRPLARLPDADADWPTQPARDQDYQFLGYRLDAKGQPTFRYRFQDVTVSDTPLPTEDPDSPGIRRTVRISAAQPSADLWWSVIAAPKIEDLGDGWYEINADWKIRLEPPANVAPRIRKQGNQQHLVVPIPLQGKPVDVVQEFRW